MITGVWFETKYGPDPFENERFTRHDRAYGRCYARKCNVRQGVVAPVTHGPHLRKTHNRKARRQ